MTLPPSLHPENAGGREGSPPSAIVPCCWKIRQSAPKPRVERALLADSTCFSLKGLVQRGRRTGFMRMPFRITRKGGCLPLSLWVVTADGGMPVAYLCRNRLIITYITIYTSTLYSTNAYCHIVKLPVACLCLPCHVMPLMPAGIKSSCPSMSRQRLSLLTTAQPLKRHATQPCIEP